MQQRHSTSMHKFPDLMHVQTTDQLASASAITGTTAQPDCTAFSKALARQVLRSARVCVAGGGVLRGCAYVCVCMLCIPVHADTSLAASVDLDFEILCRYVV